MGKPPNVNVKTLQRRVRELERDRAFLLSMRTMHGWRVIRAAMAWSYWLNRRNREVFVELAAVRLDRACRAAKKPPRARGVPRITNTRMRA